MCMRIQSLRYGEYVVLTDDGFDEDDEPQVEFMGLVPPPPIATHHHWIDTPTNYYVMLAVPIIWIFFYYLHKKVKSWEEDCQGDGACVYSTCCRRPKRVKMKK